jgi:hypothetical protein
MLVDSRIVSWWDSSEWAVLMIAVLLWKIQESFGTCTNRGVILGCMTHRSGDNLDEVES